MDPICVIDIGGTHIRSALYTRGELAVLADVPTPNLATFLKEKIPIKPFDIERIQKEIVALIVELYRDVASNHRARIETLAIGFPGPVTREGIVGESCVIFCEKLERPFDLRAELKISFARGGAAPTRTFVTNDMTASAWRYCDLGYDPFCLITVSSGVGNKIFMDNRVLVDARGLVGELGHVRAKEVGELNIECSCGSGENHIGMISSGRGIQDLARMFAARGGRFEQTFLQSTVGKKINFEAQEIENELLAKAAVDGDRFAREVIDFCVAPLAHAIWHLALSLYIRKFILIGGFALNCAYYRKSLVKTLQDEGIYNFDKDMIEEMVIEGCHDDHHTLIGLGKMVERCPDIQCQL